MRDSRDRSRLQEEEKEEEEEQVEVENTFIVGEIITVVVVIVDAIHPHRMPAGILLIRVERVALFRQSVAETVTR